MALECCNKTTKQQKKYTNSLCDFYFVRHGSTNWTHNDLSKGPQDLPLNEAGIQQAKNAGLMLKKLLCDSSNAKMVSSSLKRAVETANEIEKAMDISIDAVEDRLRERYFGDYRLVKGIDKSPPDAEKTTAFKKRIFEILDEIFLNYHDAKPLIIVSHLKVFEYITKLLIDNQEKKLLTGGIGHFIRHEDGTWELEVLTPIVGEIKELTSSRDKFFKPIKAQPECYQYNEINRECYQENYC